LENIAGWPLPDTVVEKNNGSAYHSPGVPLKRSKFMEELNGEKHGSIDKLIVKCINLSFHSKIKNMARMIIPSKVIYFLKK
jgi:hypothetical protein